MTYSNSLDPDEASQNAGLHLRSKLFDIQIISAKYLGGNTFKRKKYLKKLPCMQRVNCSPCAAWVHVALYLDVLVCHELRLALLQ